MIGSLNRSEREATVVGAGVAGLLAAYFLDRAGFEVTLCESQERAGGLILTRETQWGMVETAAHSFLVSPAVEKLCAELGVELIEVNADSRSRYIFRDGRLRKFPLSAVEIAKLASKIVFAPSVKSNEENLTMEQWTRRHLSDAVLDYLVTPFLTGIYAADPSEIGVAAAFPSMLLDEGETLFSHLMHLRRVRSGARRSAMKAPRFGMNSLISALERHLEKKLGSRFRRGNKVEAMPSAPNVILATPAHVAADLVLDEPLSKVLRQVKYSPLVTATVFARDAKKIKGVGVLIPKKENRQILGVLFNSSAFDERVKNPELSSFTVMARDGVHEDVISQELKSVLGISKVEHIEMTKWPRAIPVYSSVLLETWNLARKTLAPGQILFGNYTGQVSIRRMIETAESFF